MTLPDQFQESLAKKKMAAKYAALKKKKETTTRAVSFVGRGGGWRLGAKKSLSLCVFVVCVSACVCGGEGELGIW